MISGAGVVRCLLILIIMYVMIDSKHYTSTLTRVVEEVFGKLGKEENRKMGKQ